MTLRLTTFESVPDGFLDATSAGLHEILPGPTLVHLPGRHPEPLFVSALLHGNEEVGLKALQRLLKRHARHPLPRALSFFIGNVEAAQHGLRRLDHAPDYNRVWPGTPLNDCAEAGVMRAVVDEMRSRKVFASVDLHNNTGLNPHYGCVNRLDARFLQLASVFSRTVVYFRTPPGVQSAAFAELCPAVTCECGKTGDETGVASALEFVDAVLRLESIPAHPVREGDVHLFHTLATVKVPETATMSFDGSNADVRFVPDLDHFNFRELESGALLGWTRNGAQLVALDEHGRDISTTMLSSHDGQIRLARPLMPAMLTRDERVVRQDCLCYLMERLPLPA